MESVVSIVDAGQDHREKFRLVVLVVPVVLQLSVVNHIEESHAGDGQLEERSDPGALGEHVLVLPAPPGTAHGSGQGVRGLVAASQPGSDLAQLHLSEGHIGCKDIRTIM